MGRVRKRKENVLEVTMITCPGMPAVGLQRGMDLWGDDAAFCQITLTSCYYYSARKLYSTAMCIIHYYDIIP